MRYPPFGAAWRSAGMVDQARESECSVRAEWQLRGRAQDRWPFRRFKLAGLPEVLLDEAHGHAALSDRGGDPLDRMGPNVADREHAGQAALQEVRPLPTAAQLLSDSTAAGMSSPVGMNPERSVARRQRARLCAARRQSWRTGSACVRRCARQSGGPRPQPGKLAQRRQVPWLEPAA